MNLVQNYEFQTTKMKNLKFINLVLLFAFLSCSNNKTAKVENIDTQEFSYRIEDLVAEDGRYTYRAADGRLNKQGRYENGFKIGSWKYVIDNETYAISWGVHRDDFGDFSINYPQNWTVISTEESFLMRPNESNPQDDFFTIISYDITEIGIISINDYVSLFFEKMQQGVTNETFVDYDLLELKIEGFEKNVYFSEIKMNEKVDFNYYSCLLQKGNMIYDFTMKSEQPDESKLDYNTFIDMVYSYQDKKGKLFSNKNQIVGFKNVRIENL